MKKIVTVPVDCPTIRKVDMEAVLYAMADDRISPGCLVKEFEEQFAEFIKYPFGIATTTQTAACHLSLLSILGPNYELSLPCICNFEWYNAAKYESLPLTIQDYTPDELLIDPSNNEQLAFPMDWHDCQSIGVIEQSGKNDADELSRKEIMISDYISGKFYKSIGNIDESSIAVFGFNDNQWINTGQGGFVAYKDKDLYHKALQMIDLNQHSTTQKVYEYHMSDLQAALAKQQLLHAEKEYATRQKLTEYYSDFFTEDNKLNIPKAGGAPLHFYLKADISFLEIEKLSREMGIEVAPPSFIPIYKKLQLNSSNFPFAEKIMHGLFRIPCYPSLTRDKVDRIIKAAKHIKSI